MSYGENSGHNVTEAPEARQPVSRPERLEVTFRLGTRDVRKSYFQALCRHPRRKVYFLAYFFLAPVLLGGVSWMVGAPLLGIAIAVVVGLLILINAPRELARQAMRQYGSGGMQRICISAENVTGRAEGIGESKCEWGFVEKVTDAPDYIAFHWKNGRSGIIPKHAFPDAESAAQFFQAAAAWHAAATRSGRATREISPSQPLADAAREPVGRREGGGGQTG